MAEIGDEFGYISQQQEPRVTGWGVIEELRPEGKALVRWPNDPEHPMMVTLSLGETRKPSLPGRCGCIDGGSTTPRGG